MASETKFKAYFAELDKMVGKDDKGLERAVQDVSYTARSTASVLAEDWYRLFSQDRTVRDALALSPSVLEILPYITSVQNLGAWSALFTLILDNSTAPSSDPVKERLTLLLGLVGEAMKL